MIPFENINDINFRMQRIFSKGNSEDQTGWQLFLDGQERVTFRINATSFNTGIIANDGQLNHFFLTCDGSGGTLRLYWQGVQVSTGTLPAYNIDNSGNMSIGVYSDLFNPDFVGQMDGVRLYDRALTASEVQDLYLTKI